MKCDEKKGKSFRNKWNQHKWLIAALMLCLIALAINLLQISIPAAVKTPLYGSSQPAETVTGELAEDGRAPEGMKLAAENDALALFFDENTSEIALFDRNAGRWWYSGLTGMEEDFSGSASDAANVRSILQIRYYDPNDVLNAMNSDRDSVAGKTFEYEFLQDGLRMIFTLEKGKVTREMLPAVVEKNKFEEKVLSNLSEEERQLVEEYYLPGKPDEVGNSTVRKKYAELYPALDGEKEYYFFDLYAPGYRLEAIYQAVCVTAGYSAADIEADNEEAGYDVAVESFVRFVIPVEFVLEDAGMVVSICASQIEASAGCRLAELSLLPYFGSAGTREEGEIFVPDGSGALIHFNNGKQSAYSYRLPIYGEDAGIEKQEAGFSSAKANVPVFGLVYRDLGAMLAVIEEGESHGVIEAGVAGSGSARNWVGARFEITPMTSEKFSDVQVKVETSLYQEEPYGGRIAIRYLFAGKDEADYSGLARLYRTYLEKAGILRLREDTGMRFHVKLMAKLTREASFLGIPYEAEETVTSLSQAAEIAERLKEEGVTDMNLGLVSWFGGGIRNDAVTGGMGLASFLGGKKGLGQLLSALEGCGEFAFGADLLKVYQGWPHFNQFLYASRFMNNSLAQGYEFNPATLRPEERVDACYYLSPRYLKGVLEDYGRCADRYGVSNLWFTDAGRILASDFRSEKNVDRESAKELIEAAVAQAAADHGITANDPNLYLWKYLDNLVDLPVKSSEHMLIDESIPFLQMVLSGHAHYASRAFNRSGDLDACFLKAAETGGDPYYEWIYESDVAVSGLKGIETEEAYSMSYENWIGEAAEWYGRMKKELACVEGKEITAHSKVEEGVYRTEYGGISVIVNYNDYDVTVEGTKVGARDFKVLG